VRKFFDGIVERLEFTEFSPAEFIVQGDTVVVFGSEAGKVKATGRAFCNERTPEIRRGRRSDHEDDGVQHPGRAEKVKTI